MVFRPLLAYQRPKLCVEGGYIGIDVALTQASQLGDRRGRRWL